MWSALAPFAVQQPSKHLPVLRQSPQAASAVQVVRKGEGHKLTIGCEVWQLERQYTTRCRVIEGAQLARGDGNYAVIKATPCSPPANPARDPRLHHRKPTPRFRVHCGISSSTLRPPEHKPELWMPPNQCHLKLLDCSYICTSASSPRESCLVLPCTCKAGAHRVAAKGAVQTWRHGLERPVQSSKPRAPEILDQCAEIRT